MSALHFLPSLTTLTGVAATAAPDLAPCRKKTEKLMRHYAELSVARGWAPSTLGCRSHWANGLGNASIFLYDIKRCLHTLHASQRQLLLSIAAQECTLDDIAAMSRTELRRIRLQYAAALDALTAILIERDLLPEG